MPLPPGCSWIRPGELFFDPACGQEIFYNEGSSDNCDGALFLKYLSNRPEAVAAQKRREAQEVKSADLKALGPVIGKLAQVIRKRKATALNQEMRALAKSLRSRRRRAISIDE